MWHTSRLGRVDLLFVDSPQLQLALARAHQRVGLCARTGIVGVSQLLAVLLCQPVVLDRRRHLRTVYIRHRLAAPHTLACVLHIELVHTPADARAHRCELRFGLLHAAKCVDVGLQRFRADLGNLDSGRGNLRWSQLQRCARLRPLVCIWLRCCRRLFQSHRSRRSRLRSVGVVSADDQDGSSQYSNKKPRAGSHHEQFLFIGSHLLVLSMLKLGITVLD